MNRQVAQGLDDISHETGTRRHILQNEQRIFYHLRFGKKYYVLNCLLINMKKSAYSTQ